MRKNGAGRRLAIRAGLIVLCACVFLLLWRPAVVILGPFALAWCLARAMEPVIAKLSGGRRGIRNVLALILVIAFFLVLIGVFCWLAVRLFTELQSLSDSWTELLAILRQWADAVAGRVIGTDTELLERTAETLDSLTESLSGAVGSLTSALIGLLSSWVSYAASALMFLLVFGMGAVIMSRDYEAMRGSLRDRVLRPDDNGLYRVLRVVRTALGGHLLRAVIRALLVIVTCLAGFSVMKVSYIAVLALLLGVLDFLPVIGPGAVLLTWSAASFAGGSWRTGLLLLLLYGVLVCERVLLSRHYEEESHPLGSFAELCCVFVGWKLWGVLGILLGPALVRILVNLYGAGMFRGTLSDLSDLVRQIWQHFHTDAANTGS